MLHPCGKNVIIIKENKNNGVNVPKKNNKQLEVCDKETRYICNTDPSEKLRPVTLTLRRSNHVAIGPHATNTGNGANKLG